MNVPMHNNTHVPPVEGMVFLGTHKDADLYFIPHNETGLHAITLVDGPDDWQWESSLVIIVRQGNSYYREGGSWHFGLVEATKRGLVTDNLTLGGLMQALTA